ncbi:MAG: hypothetical protein JRG91_01190, partial [Deltaproteobacteria bacterium]|nr:hypothetical protein [Deltaproteobacteria bacterium]
MSRLALTALLSALVLSPPARAQEEEKSGDGEVEKPKPKKKTKDPKFESYVFPIRAQAGPLLSPPLGAVPRTELWGSAGVLYGKSGQGRTTYRLLTARLVLGGEWSPKKLPKLGLGGEIVALQVTNLNTELPPAIDEWVTFFDLGILRLHARYMAFSMRTKIMELAVTPFLRLGLPTDTSRVRENRHMPIRHVLDDRTVNAPYVLIEPGVNVGLTLGPVSIYTHQAPVLAPVHGEAFHFIWSMHFGAAVDILHVVDVSFDISGLLRPTKAHQEDPDTDRASRAEPYLTAFALCPGVRLKRGTF